ncbi:class I SAM-dependent methyltransferase [Saccharopolyspora sp. NPDC003752]
MTAIEHRNDLRLFVRTALQSPARVGALTPTGRAVSALTASVAPDRPDATVVELGPGTGSITDAITARMAGSGRQFAVELDPGLAAHLRRTRHGVRVLQADALALDEVLAGAGIRPGSVDAVVSSLPWTLLAPEDRAALLRSVAGALRPDGTFSAIGYLTALPHKARSFRRQLEATFRETRTSSVVWSNLPPARVYRCRGPVV